MTHPTGDAGSRREPLPPIKFKDLADALLPFISTILDQVLPGGKIQANEYFVRSAWRVEKTPSLSVCIKGNNVGKWRDHGGDKAGVDLISLVASVRGIDNAHAAIELAHQFGLESVAGIVHTEGTSRPPPPKPPVPAPAVQRKSDERWSTVVPVPDYAPAFVMQHHHYTESNIDHIAEYRRDAELFGYVVRVLKSDGGKLPLPYTWCKSERDGSMRWRNRSWDGEAKPLFFPLGQSPRGRTVILVEGEKKASILQALLDAGAPGVYIVCSWVGGCNGRRKADWAWLKDCFVIMWPDCDGKREQLSKAERSACPDDLQLEVLQAGKPLLPAAEQVGMKAMLDIGAILRDQHGCTVQLLPIPEPGTVDDGWDCADAISTDGWDYERVQTFFGSAYALPAGGAAVAPVAASSGNGGDDKKNRDRLAEAGDGDDAFRDHVDFVCEQLKCKVHDLGVNRKLLITALRKAPALKDCLGFNELTEAPCTRVAWPWRSLAGTIAESDDLALGDWLSTTYHLKAASRASLAEAIDTVADGKHFHPIRDWLRGLKRDKKSRIDKWLIHVLELDPKTLEPKLRRYLELVGRYMLLGLVARVMDPGCKFDYAPVLEGVTGTGKSTFIKTLVGKEYFSDTHFELGQSKDGMEQFAGLWAYEMSEMTPLRRADSELVKQFFSSQEDRFRGAYGRYVQKHPRQLVIFCSTNKRQYLFDTTGNRRFWPFWIGSHMNLDWLQKYRELLFAEAFELYTSESRIYPSHEEEELYFVPEQEKRMVETSVQSRLFDLLTREGAPGGEGKLSSELNQHVSFVTLDKLVMSLGTDPGKSNTVLEGQIRGWLEAQGWTACRESVGQRRRGFKQPAVWPPKIEDDEAPSAPVRPTQADEPRGNDDEPF